MTILNLSNRVWQCILVCFVLCSISFIALAQERASDPPKEETKQENRAVLDFQKPEKIIIQERKTGDADRPLISGKTTKPEPRAASGYLKIGDIKGDSTTEAKPKTKAHTPEWTNDKTGDPGRTATDDRHKDWINLDSMNSPRPPDTGMKIKAADQTPRYECPQDDSECYCHGVLDCKNLWASGVCQENSEWEDGNDPSEGGCIED